MYWNVHLDGLERTHDLIVEREGVFKECILAIKMAKLLGYQVATNTTIYKETDMTEVEQMFDFLSDLGVDGHTISPGYEYDAAKKDMIKRLNLQPENFFLTRKMTIEKFKKIEDWMQPLHVLRDADLFRIPRRQTRPDLLRLGDSDAQHPRLERPLLSDDRRALFQLRGVAGESAVGQLRRGRRRGAETARCENCMVHCGYEPTASLGLQAKRGDTWKNIRFNFGAKPKPTGKGNEIAAFNGVTSGNGHLDRQDKPKRQRKLPSDKWPSDSPANARSRCRAPFLTPRSSISRRHDARDRERDRAARRRIYSGSNSQTDIGAANCWSIARSAPTTSSSCIGSGEVDERLQERCVRHILKRQLPDGGWNIYYGGPSEMNASVKAYFALKLAGHSAELPFMQEARANILRLGGIPRMNTFSKLYLALLGQFPWQYLPSIPVEMILLPNWSPFNIYKMSSWSRAMLIPLAIINHFKPTRELPGLKQLHELYPLGTEHKDFTLPRDPRFFAWRNFFLRADHALN